jgi:hypothetical protein
MANDFPSDEELRTLTSLESTLHPEETTAQFAQRIFTENAPLAAQQIVSIAQHGSTDRIRLEASKYVTDRVLGKIGEAAKPDEDPFVKFMKEVMANSVTETETETETDR